MISANFYPTQSSQVSGEIELTSAFNSITDYNGASAYWLGYINRDNVPQFRKLTDFKKEFDRETGRLKSAHFIPIETENLDFTYAAWGTVNACKCFTNPQGDIVSMYSQFTPWRYINKCKVGLVRMRTPNFNFMLMVRTGSDGQTWDAPQRIAVGSGFEDTDSNDNGFEAFYKFVKGELSLTKTFAFSGISIDITINANDLNENYYIPVNGENNGVFYDGILFIYRAWFDPTWNLSTPFDDSTASVTNGCIHTVGVTDLFDDDGNVYYTGSDWYQMARNETNAPDFFYLHRDYTTGAGGNIYPTSFGSNSAGLPIMTYDNLHYIGGYDFEIGFDNSVWGNANHIIYTNGNIACINQYDNQVFCYTMIRPVDIRYNAALAPRYEAGWLPEYDENNCPTGEFFKDSERLDRGRPWQIDELSDNEYTEEDRPPYSPPSDDDTDSGGDDIRTIDWTINPVSAANNFITLYGLNYKTLADFGQQMWANLADPAFWQMVGTAFTNDFSINPADMMRYFVSLRFFPFDLSELNNTLASGIYIGRAATPIAPTAGQDIPYPIRLSNNIAQLSGGRLTISRYYNDFRDYEPCTTVQIHVPFCGSVDVPASEVMGHEMDLTYKIDLQTGAMLAVLGVASNTYYVIATLAGTCGATIPITANNNIEFLQRIATVGSGIIGGGISGAVKGATVGGEVGAVVGAVAGTVGGGVGALAGLPPVTVHKQGNASGFANLGGVPYAYATVQRGRFERPANYGHTTGFACDFSATLGNLSGFTVCDNVDTSGLTCNADERDEIKRLLESGVYV